MVCTFFGHRNTSDEIAPQVKAQIIRLIEKENVDRFLVGNNGSFDRIVREILKEIKSLYPHVSFFIVLAYLPTEKDPLSTLDYENTIYADIPAGTPRRFAINARNLFMIKKADFVITHVTRSFGGAAKHKEIAEKHKKIVINI